MPMTDAAEDALAPLRRRLAFRASHRGTREADMMIGGFVGVHVHAFTAAEIAWFEMLLAENDVDIMAWMTKSRACPAQYATPMMARMQQLHHLGAPQ